MREVTEERLKALLNALTQVLGWCRFRNNTIRVVLVYLVDLIQILLDESNPLSGDMSLMEATIDPIGFRERLLKTIATNAVTTSKDCLGCKNKSEKASDHTCLEWGGKRGKESK